jgi:hypothetical protein
MKVFTGCAVAGLKKLKTLIKKKNKFGKISEMIDRFYFVLSLRGLNSLILKAMKDSEFDFLGCDTMQSYRWIPTFWRNTLLPCLGLITSVIPVDGKICGKL